MLKVKFLQEDMEQQKLLNPFTKQSTERANKEKSIRRVGGLMLKLMQI